MAVIIPINKAEIKYESILNDIIKNAELPDGRILLIFYNENLPGNEYGMCMPKILLPYMHMHEYLVENYDFDWDCGVVISKLVCDYLDGYPAFFTYVLNHEFGHVYNFFTNPELYIHSNLITNYIYKASKGKVSSWLDIPEELFCDKYSILITEKIFSRMQLNKEIETITKNNGDSQRLERLYDLEGSNEFHRLKQELINLSKPFKDELIVEWKNAVINAKNTGFCTLVESINNYDALFTDN